MAKSAKKKKGREKKRKNSESYFSVKAAAHLKELRFRGKFVKASLNHEKSTFTEKKRKMREERKIDKENFGK